MKTHMTCSSFVGCYEDVNASEAETLTENVTELGIQPDLMGGIRLLREHCKLGFLHLLDDDELF